MKFPANFKFQISKINIINMNAKEWDPKKYQQVLNEDAESIVKLMDGKEFNFANFYDVVRDYPLPYHRKMALYDRAEHIVKLSDLNNK